MRLTDYILMAVILILCVYIYRNRSGKDLELLLRYENLEQENKNLKDSLLRKERQIEIKDNEFKRLEYVLVQDDVLVDSVSRDAVDSMFTDFLRHHEVLHVR